MLKKMARATFLLMVTVMVVAWALSLGKTETHNPPTDEPAETWYMYA